MAITVTEPGPGCAPAPALQGLSLNYRHLGEQTRPQAPLQRGLSHMKGCQGT